MRLKEPLYGVRAAGIHYLLHLGLLITMIYIEGSAKKNDFDGNSPHTKEKDEPIVHSTEFPGILDYHEYFNVRGFYSRAFESI